MPTRGRVAPRLACVQDRKHALRSLRQFALSWGDKRTKSGIGILLYNSYTAYIQRFKLFAQLFERLVFVLVEEEQGVLSFK